MSLLQSSNTRMLRRWPQARPPAASCVIARAVAATRAQGPMSAQEAQLRSWIVQEGGFIHPSLLLTDQAPCGVRGVVALHDIDAAVLEATPLVSIPRHLHLDNRHALKAAEQVLDGPQLDAFDELTAAQQVACVLAWYKSQPGGPWSHYLATLPAMPPNPWLQTDADVSQSLIQLEKEKASTRCSHAESILGRERPTSSASEEDAVVVEDAVSSQPSCWLPHIQAVRQHFEAQAKECVEICGQSMNISDHDVLWALAQVASRSLGSGSSSGLLPYIDLLNHCANSRPPMMQLDDQDRVVMTVTSLQGNELAPMTAGDELYISYQAEDLTPFQAFNKFGYVPPELW